MLDDDDDDGLPDGPVLFAVGRIAATPGALSLLDDTGVSPLYLVMRHCRGDYGDTDDHDTAANNEALVIGARVFSVYRLQAADYEHDGVVWCITEADRSSTTLLLPDEY